MPCFSILIVLYKSPLVLIEKNLRGLDFENFEVVIVDNSEDSAYFTMVKDWLEMLPPQIRGKVKLYQSPQNKGYTGGNNLAFKHSSGKYLVIINPDMDLNSELLVRAEKILDRKSWEILAPKVYFNEKKKILQVAFVIFRKYNPLNMLKVVGLNGKDTGQYNAYYETFCAPGGCLIITRDLFKRLKGFDENYFMYTEETDLCYRAQLLKMKPVYCPQLIATHVHEKGDSLFALQQMLRNNLMFFGKFFSFRLLYVQFLYSFIRFLLSFPTKAKTGSKKSFFISLLKKLIEGFVMGWKYLLVQEGV